jgi:formiminoglutamase
VSPWRARKDADWWIDRLYGFARDLGATVVHTAVSRTVIDVNRDPSGASLYPGQATTGLCPVETFDGEPLYRPGLEPDAAEIERRKRLWFAPYHAALAAEVARLRALHPAIVVYDGHSIRSTIPRLFEGTLPQFNIGTNSGAACASELEAQIAGLAAASGLTSVVNGRFKGGWITRSLGNPAGGVHAVQMELACRGYMIEPDGALDAATWPSPWDPAHAEPVRAVLAAILAAALAFAQSQPRSAAR